MRFDLLHVFTRTSFVRLRLYLVTFRLHSGCSSACTAPDFTPHLRAIAAPHSPVALRTLRSRYTHTPHYYATPLLYVAVSHTPFTAHRFVVVPHTYRLPLLLPLHTLLHVTPPFVPRLDALFTTFTLLTPVAVILLHRPFIHHGYSFFVCVTRSLRSFVHSFAPHIVTRSASFFVCYVYRSFSPPFTTRSLPVTGRFDSFGHLLPFARLRTVAVRCPLFTVLRYRSRLLRYLTRRFYHTFDSGAFPFRWLVTLRFTGPPPPRTYHDFTMRLRVVRSWTLPGFGYVLRIRTFTHLRYGDPVHIPDVTHRLHPLQTPTSHGYTEGHTSPAHCVC